MGRSKKPRAKRRQPPRPPPPPEPWSPLLWACNLLRTLARTLARAVEHSWRLVIGLSVLFGVLAGAFFFLPRIAVDPAEPADEKNPFGSAIFIVANTGMIPLTVSAQFSLCVMRFENGMKINGEIAGDCNRHNEFGGDTSDQWQNHYLEIDGKWTLRLDDVFKTPMVNPKPVFYDGAILISYRPDFLLKTWHKDFRFIGTMQPNGKVLWTHQTIDK